MKVICLPVGELATNCYLAADENGAAAVIDPGDAAQEILARAAQEKLTIAAVLLTHAHFDHMLAAGEIREATGALLYVYADDQPALTDPVRSLTAFFTPGQDLRLTADRVVREGDVIEAGQLRFSVLHTPGHTPGSCCYLCGRTLFSGDTLFMGSEGRTDFPGGDPHALAASLRRLAALEGDCAVYPGHGPATTLSRERAENPYITGRYDEFDT